VPVKRRQHPRLSSLFLQLYSQRPNNCCLSTVSYIHAVRCLDLFSIKITVVGMRQGATVTVATSGCCCVCLLGVGCNLAASGYVVTSIVPGLHKNA
jgi:hypothetical protein